MGAWTLWSFGHLRVKLLFVYFYRVCQIYKFHIISCLQEEYNLRLWHYWNWPEFLKYKNENRKVMSPFNVSRIKTKNFVNYKIHCADSKMKRPFERWDISLVYSCVFQGKGFQMFHLYVDNDYNYYYDFSQNLFIYLLYSNFCIFYNISCLPEENSLRLFHS